MDQSEREELEELRREMHLNSLGDKPHSMPVMKLRRLIQLEDRAANSSEPESFCWVCRTSHELIASKCPAMWDIT